MHRYDEEAIGERLRDLLATCDQAAALARRLVAQESIESLRALLQDRSDDYRRSAVALVGCLQSMQQASADSREAPALGVVRGADRSSAWEAAECEALVQFRDALDAELPAPAERVVLRHIDDGVRALERLRELRRRSYEGGHNGRRFVGT